MSDKKKILDKKRTVVSLKRLEKIDYYKYTLDLNKSQKDYESKSKELEFKQNQMKEFILIKKENSKNGSKLNPEFMNYDSQLHIDLQNSLSQSEAETRSSYDEFKKYQDKQLSAKAKLNVYEESEKESDEKIYVDFQKTEYQEYSIFNNNGGGKKI